MASNTIRKPELDAVVAEALGISKELAGEVVASAFEEIILGVAQDGQVQIPGFGSFVKRHRNARSGRNPRDGATIQIAAHEAVIFRAGTKLKLAVNQ